jgi:beta-phosphoglucomutase-like phosphatase (HAD superfamily)
MKQAKFAGVLFDCDGVLVDSELITNRVLCEMLNQRGWAISLEETMQVFLGKAVKDEADLISQKTGQLFDQNWLIDFSKQRNMALKKELQAIPHIHTAMQDIVLAYGKK